jgi:hypothetical protein
MKSNRAELFRKAILKFFKNKKGNNVLRIYEVRLNEIINYKQMLVSVSCIYDVSSSNGLI